MRLALAIPFLVLLFLLPGGCAPGQGLFNAPPPTPMPESPPEDFWVSVTIYGPIRSGGQPAIDALPRSMRPGRYVVEPDRQLRAALGAGATDASFPPPTRRLTQNNLADLYRLCRAADLFNPKHPNLASSPPDPETIIGKTVYAITTHAREKRVLVVMEAEPELSDGAKKAQPVIEWLAGQAWVAAPGK